MPKVKDTNIKGSEPDHQVEKEEQVAAANLQHTDIAACRESLLGLVEGMVGPTDLLDQVHENQTPTELAESERQLAMIAEVEATVAGLRSLPREMRAAAMQHLLGRLSAIRGMDGDFADLPIEAQVLTQISEATLLVAELQVDVSLVHGRVESRSHPGWVVKPRYNTVHVTLPEGTAVRNCDGAVVLEEGLDIDIEADLETPEGEVVETEGKTTPVTIVNGFLISLFGADDEDEEDDSDEDESTGS